MNEPSQKLNDSRKRSHKPVVQALRYRTKALWLIVLYISLTLIPWVLTCVLAHRPLNSGSYTRQRGFDHHQVSSMHNWKTTVDVLNSIAGLITIPILSTILAQAAVLFCQRRKPNDFLSLRDMFVLADRGWTNPSLIWKSIRSRQKMPGQKSSLGFLLPEACLILIGAIQQPVYQLLVGVGKISVVTCRDIPCRPGFFVGCTDFPLYERIGRDIEPAQMALVEHSVIRSRMASELASISVDESQSHLWSVSGTYKSLAYDYTPLSVETTSLRHWVFKRNDIALSSYLTEPIPNFFVAGLPAKATTGVLRQHIMRLNSSISCEAIDAGEFPSPCPGDQPLTVLWERFLDTKVRICVPGDYTAFPWSLGRSRQDHTEEMYIHVQDTSIGRDDGNTRNAPFYAGTSLRCTATTTRGYFELGNDRNNNTAGPLLEHWPGPADMAENYNDWTDSWGDCISHIPWDIDDCSNDLFSSPQDVDPLDPRTWQVPGPLMASAVALFGSGSWLNTAAEHVSHHTYNGTDQSDDYLAENLTWPLFWRGMPYSNLWAPGDEYDATEWSDGNFVSLCGHLEQRMFDNLKSTNQDLFELTQQFFATFAPGFHGGENLTLNKAQNLLEIAMFVANRASLSLLSTEVSQNVFDDLDGRRIYSSPGVAVPKAIVSRRNAIILSVLMGLQLLGLGYLTYYLYRVPSWSDQLNAMAIASIGASLEHRGVLPALGPVSKKDLATLQTVGGLIGIVEKSPRRESLELGSILPDMAGTDGSAVELQRLTSSEEGRISVEDDTLRFELELDAPGPILTTDLSRRTPYAFGVKRAWNGMFSSKHDSVGDVPLPPASPRNETSASPPASTPLPCLSLPTRLDDDARSISE